jgi:hypothetical protein
MRAAISRSDFLTADKSRNFSHRWYTSSIYGGRKAAVLFPNAADILTTWATNSNRKDCFLVCGLTGLDYPCSAIPGEEFSF